MSGFGPLNDGWRSDATWQPPVSLDTFLPLENTPLDDGGDSWWAGVQHNFVSVPRAASLAALSMSAALCAGLQQQTDEVVPWLSAEVTPYAPTPQRLQHQTLFIRWHQVDELPVAPPSLAADEDSYTIALPSFATAVGVLWATDEGVLPSTAGPDEDGWAPSPPQGARVAWQLPALADELPGVAAPPALDDSAWAAPPSLQPSAVLPQLGAADELVSPPPALDEGYWRVEAWPASAVAQLALAPPDEVPTVAATLLVDEALWLAEAPASVPPVRWVAHATDEVVPQPTPTLEDSAWAAPPPMLAAALRLAPVEVDELPLPVPALDDGYWAALGPVVAAPVRLAALDVDEFPAALPLALEDERWVPGFALSVPISAPTWVDLDVAVTPPQPQVEEAYWLPLASLPSQAYRYNFLAQDELVPSTSVLESLARTYAVNAEQRGYAVSAERRQAAQSAERRTLIVDPQKRST